MIKGVESTMVGYTGGTTSSPTYSSVCGGDGHTEAILVEFDSAKVSYLQLLDVFFKGCCAVSSGNPQYKSAIWYYKEEHRSQAKEKAAELGKMDLDVEEAVPWWNAEDYHQKYYQGGRGR